MKLPTLFNRFGVKSWKRKGSYLVMRIPLHLLKKSRHAFPIEFGSKNLDVSRKINQTLESLKPPTL